MSAISSIKGSKYILFSGVIFLSIIISVFLYMDKPAYEYALSQKDMLGALMENKHLYTPEEVLEKIKRNDSNVVLIDLRPPYEFNKGHIKTSINIPYQDILSEEYENIFFDVSKEKILYHAGQEGASGPWMLLHQIGVKKQFVLLGGYESYKKIFIEHDTLVQFEDEVARFDFSKLINKNGTTSSNVVEKPMRKLVRRKKKKSVDGGC